MHVLGQMLASCLDSQQRNDDSNQPLPPKRTKQITVAGNAVQSNAGVVVSIQAFVKLNKGDKIRTLINVEKVCMPRAASSWASLCHLV